MTNKKKILFVSNSSPDRINHILDAFQNRNDLEIKVENLWIQKRKNSFLNKVFEKLKIPLDNDALNKRILDQMSSFKPDIVFIVKGNNIYPSTLKNIKSNYENVKLISWSLDDMYARHNRSYYYTKGLKFYDTVFTLKSYNLNELRELGASDVEFLYQAFSKKYHKLCRNCKEVKYKSDVLFIGFAEIERFNDLKYLADNGIKIDIFGSGWNKPEFKNVHKNLNVTSNDLLGNDYSNAISCSKISLCFLRKANRDLHTSRSIEIPACGGFMLAERTDEHKKLFEEDKEAVYFDNKEELLTKTKYYLKNEAERERVANASYNKTRKDDYSYDNMISRILNAI